MACQSSHLPPSTFQHLQEPRNAGSRPEAPFLNTLIEHFVC
jgi:hypothetical protein